MSCLNKEQTSGNATWHMRSTLLVSLGAWESLSRKELQGCPTMFRIQCFASFPHLTCISTASLGCFCKVTINSALLQTLPEQNCEPKRTFSNEDLLSHSTSSFYAIGFNSCLSKWSFSNNLMILTDTSTTSSPPPSTHPLSSHKSSNSPARISSPIQPSRHLHRHRLQTLKSPLSKELAPQILSH